MSRRMVWGVTLKCCASASMDMKPRWPTSLTMLACRSSRCMAWRSPVLLRCRILPPAARIRKHPCGWPLRMVRNRVSMGKAAKGNETGGRGMATRDLILSIDQGTTSTRAIVFTAGGDAVATAQKALPQIYPADGWVEHDPEEIWSATVEVCRKVLADVGAERFGAIGITNQRETAVVWDRKTGKPIHNAIVWQDRRGAPLCRNLIESGHEPEIQKKT